MTAYSEDTPDKQRCGVTGHSLFLWDGDAAENPDYDGECCYCAAWHYRGAA